MDFQIKEAIDLNNQLLAEQGKKMDKLIEILERIDVAKTFGPTPNIVPPIDPGAIPPLPGWNPGYNDQYVVPNKNWWDLQNQLSPNQMDPYAWGANNALQLDPHDSPSVINAKVAFNEEIRRHNQNKMKTASIGSMAQSNPRITPNGPQGYSV